MISNFHTHTYRCRHATGDVEDYIRRAIGLGIQKLGFSEHGPLPHIKDNRLRLSELDEYISTVRKAKAKYADKIEILTGLEIEYFKEYDEYYGWLRNKDLDYMVLGQHYVTLGDDVRYVNTISSKTMRSLYVTQLIEAMKTRYFDFVAHPDIFVKHKDEHTLKLIRKVLDTARALDLPLEVNGQGLRAQQNYPRPFFWKMAQKAGCLIIHGSDAHNVKDLGDSSDRAIEMVSRINGYRLINDFRRA